MKLKLINYSVLAAALSLIGVCSARAEVDQVEKANIPFDFYANNQKMPAGTYNIGIDLVGDIISLRNSSGHAVLLMGVPANDGGGEQSDLVFDHAGNSYFLREVKSDELDVSFSTTKKQAARMQSAHVPLTRNHS
jgi:hypothetical protein